MPGKHKRYRVKQLVIDELSGVSTPAQEHAQTVLMKRADGPRSQRVKKDDLVSVVTGQAAGHQHGISVERYGDSPPRIYVSYAQAEGAETGHDHQLIRQDDGTYKVLTNAGHTHSLNSAALSAAIIDAVTKEEDMNDVEKAAMKKLEDDNARLGKIVGLTAARKAHYDTLIEDAKKDAFLAMTPENQDREIQVAKEAEEAAKAAEDAKNPVVYTTKSGIAIRKSDGEATLALAKQADEDRERADKAEKAAKEAQDTTAWATYQKRAAEELGNMPGDITTFGRTFSKSVSTPLRTRNARKEALAALKAKNAKMSTTL